MCVCGVILSEKCLTIKLDVSVKVGKKTIHRQQVVKKSVSSIAYQSDGVFRFLLVKSQRQISKNGDRGGAGTKSSQRKNPVCRKGRSPV